MKLAAVAQRYLDALERAPKLSNEEIFRALIAQDCAVQCANEVIQLAPIAFGRVFFREFGVTFSADFCIFSAEGELLQSGPLIEHRVFVEMDRLASKLFESADPLGARIAVRSPELDAVNSALSAGSQPANLRASPVALFADPPSEEGLRRARRFISSLL